MEEDLTPQPLCSIVRGGNETYLSWGKARTLCCPALFTLVSWQCSAYSVGGIPAHFWYIHVYVWERHFRFLSCSQREERSTLGTRFVCHLPWKEKVTPHLAAEASPLGLCELSPELRVSNFSEEWLLFQRWVQTGGFGGRCVDRRGSTGWLSQAPGKTGAGGKGCQRATEVVEERCGGWGGQNSPTCWNGGAEATCKKCIFSFLGSRRRVRGPGLGWRLALRQRPGCGSQAAITQSSPARRAHARKASWELSQPLDRDPSWRSPALICFSALRLWSGWSKVVSGAMRDQQSWSRRTARLTKEKLINKGNRSLHVIDMHVHRYGAKYKPKNCFYLISYAYFILKTARVFHMTCKGWLPCNYATHWISSAIGSDI